MRTTETDHLCASLDGIVQTDSDLLAKPIKSVLPCCFLLFFFFFLLLLIRCSRGYEVDIL